MRRQHVGLNDESTTTRIEAYDFRPHKANHHCLNDESTTTRIEALLVILRVSEIFLVLTTNPLQQGLKLVLSVRAELRAPIVLTTNPLQQGLKLCLLPLLCMTPNSLNDESTTTRIEAILIHLWCNDAEWS